MKNVFVSQQEGETGFMDTRHATGDTLKHGAESILKKKPMYVGTITLLTLFIFFLSEFVSLSFKAKLFESRLPLIHD